MLPYSRFRVISVETLSSFTTVNVEEMPSVYRESDESIRTWVEGWIRDMQGDSDRQVEELYNQRIMPAVNLRRYFTPRMELWHNANEEHLWKDLCDVAARYVSVAMAVTSFKEVVYQEVPMIRTKRLMDA